MTRFPDLFAALAAPFASHEVKTRTQSGRSMEYVTARTVMNRLDSVLGPENWSDDYSSGGESSILCRLTILLPDGQALTKADAGGFAGMADSGDDDKSAYSDSFKRAAVKFGVGRYLYRDGVPSFVATASAVALPVAVAPSRPIPAASANGHANGQGNGQGNAIPPNRVNNPKPSGPPQTGRQLFAWSKDREQEYEVGILRYLTSWGKLQEFPGRMVDWNPDQVALGHAEVLRKLESVTTAATTSNDGGNGS